MRKFLILAVAGLLSGCSVWNDLNWSALNPWSESEDEVSAQTEAEPDQLQQMKVNKYLWQASLDKLAVMGIETENPDEGRIITAWKTPSGVSNERFKVVAEIDDIILRADALHIKAYREVLGRNGWTKVPVSQGFENELAQHIITQAKILYRNDKE